MDCPDSTRLEPGRVRHAARHRPLGRLSVLEVPREAVEPWLEGHRDQLDSLSHALVEAETLDANDAYTAAGTLMRPTELVSDAGHGHSATDVTSRSST